MEKKLSIRLITFSNGERYPLLLNQQGQPHWRVIDAIAVYKGELGKNPSKKMEIFQHHYLCIIDGC
jgi:hypothetical protein